MIAKTSLFTILATLLVVSSASNVFATPTNPYVTGYPTTSTISIHSEYTMKTNFNNVAGSRTQNLAAVYTTAGFASTTATDPTGWFYQQGVDLHSDNYIYAEEQTRGSSGCTWHCPIDNTNWNQLGHYGTASTDIDYTYTVLYWGGSPHNVVNFYFEPHFVNGSSTSAPLAQYSPGSFSDTSQYFATGLKSKTLGGNTYHFKFFQFGVESQDPVTTAWNVKEYDLTHNVNVSYNSDTTEATSTSTQTDYTNNSWITYDATNVSQVGLSQYSANAHSHHNDGTIASGTVTWYYSATPITRGTTLWP